MRVIYRASLVFLLKDFYSKMPITNASILCNGKQNPYTRKDNGAYVFSNLYPGTYTIDISCSGYVDLHFSAEVRENETSIFKFNMPYAVNSEAMTRVTHFEIKITHTGEVLASKDVRLRLADDVKAIKLLEPVAVGSNLMKLSIDEMVSGLMGQSYVYETKDKKYFIEIVSFDAETKSYILKEEVKEEIPVEGKFYPYWDLKTDSHGIVVMPYINTFMRGGKVNLECTISNMRRIVRFNIEGKERSGETFYADAKLIKMSNSD